ncbi:aldose 1-epimerase family protein [Streptomyces sp. NPDC048639]|uniref:aldose 1-epimerase family protein n=1 Tax=Streptomyces sp. NPDC048639 TaxID=3365581 RepID=UPI0037191301
MTLHHDGTESAQPGRRGVLTAGIGTGLALLGTGTGAAHAATRTVPSERRTSPSSLSGESYEISRGEQRLIVTELGAGLRSYTVKGHQLLDTFSPDSYPTGASYGQVLIPWPNRIDHGTYTFDGTEQVLPWSEPAQANAIHGLTRWMNWEVVERSTSRLVMGLTLHAQPGYPFVLRLRQTYELTEHGLLVTNAARNTGADRVPYGVGAHPYFTLGTEYIDDIVLTLPARKWFRTDDRGIPLPPPVPVAGTSFDFLRPRRLRDTVLDTGFAELVRNGDGLAVVRMTSPESPVSLEVWQDRQHEFLQVYTGDTLPDPDGRRRGLAIEPYSCAANAFNNGYGLKVLPPGGEFRAQWGVRPVVRGRRR